MSYNIQHLNTAGRATIFTIITGVFTFAVAFIFNLGASEFSQAIAQQGDTAATTSVTVVNLPPVISGYGVRETLGSSTSTPTNSGDTVTWDVLAVDDNGENYWLILCSQHATPTISAGSPVDPPTCTGASNITWAVSTAKFASAATATAATTTARHDLAGNNFDQENMWYGYVCDDNELEPKCTDTEEVGPSFGIGSTSAPFYINNPPDFDLIVTNSSTTNPDPVDPGGNLFYYSTSSDSDNSTTTDVTDTVQLFVCSTQSFDYASRACTATTYASTTYYATQHASSTYILPNPMQDYDYVSYVYLIDWHGYGSDDALQGSAVTFRVDNTAPYLNTVDINNGSTTLYLTQEAATTTGFQFEIDLADDNYCVNHSALGANPEIVNLELSFYRASTTGNYGSTTCRVNIAGDHNYTDCYTSAASTTSWSTLSCTASSTSCDANLANNDKTKTFVCDFGLSYVTDPTDGTSASNLWPNDDWRVLVRGIDDDYATGTPEEGSFTTDVGSLLAFDLQTFAIPYGRLAPGQNSDDLTNGNLGLGLSANTASSTIIATGNVGLDQELEGSSMCKEFTGTSSPCNNSSTSTINAYEQVYATSSAQTYLQASSTAAQHLSSTTPQELEINILKSTSTTAQSSGKTYWGIQIPATITRSGDFYGLNTFYAKTSEPAEWQ